MAKRARKGEFWLVRPRKNSFYGLYRDNPERDGDGYWDSTLGPYYDFCPSLWEAVMPRSLHLKPGGGPIRIRVEQVK